jgi:hypothetical protein
MLPTFALLLALLVAIIAACRIWLRRAWQRTRQATAEPAWHEQWLGQRRETTTNLEDMNPNKVLSPLIFRAMPSHQRSSPAWHEQWLAEARRPTLDDDDEWTAIEPLAEDDRADAGAGDSRTEDSRAERTE